MSSSKQYTMYGGEISWYSGKLRAYLRYKDVPHQELPSGRDVYKTIIVPRVGWPVIPVLISPDDEVMQDTSDIIDALERRFVQAPVLPAGPKQKVLALMFEVYGDEWLGLPAMHYRWNHNTEWIIQQFGKLTRPDLDEAAQREAGERACKPFRGSLPFIGVTAETQAAVEASYEALLTDLDAHFGKFDFLFGSRPSIGDYGLIGPLYAHLYRDPASGDLMNRIAPNVSAWVLRMMDPEPLAGEFLPDDEIPPTLLPILQRMIDEQLPVIHSSISAIEQWLSANPGEQELPRSIGRHRFRIAVGTDAEVEGERMIFPFVQWMWQRPYDAYYALSDADKTQVQDLLAQVGGANAFDVPVTQRVERKNFKLVRG